MGSGSSVGIEIEEITGYYSNRLPNFYSKDLILNNGCSVSVNVNKEIKQSVTESIFFSNEVDINFARSLKSKIFNEAEHKVKESIKSFDKESHLICNMQYNYFIGSVTTTKVNTTYTLTKEAARKCPDGYGMSIASIGKYHKVKAQRRFGKYPLQHKEKLEYYEFFVVNESLLTDTYVYKPNDSNDIFKVNYDGETSWEKR